MKKKSIIIIMSLSVMLVTGCVSFIGYRPMSSKPPESVIVVTSQFKATVSLLGDYATFPTGEYHPLYEDNSGYYFQAPTKAIIVSVGISVEADDAGLFVKRGAKEPTKWYVIRDSYKQCGNLKTNVSYELIP